MDSIALGEVEVTRVLEWAGRVGTVSRVFPDVPAALWRDNRAWLAPDFWDPATGAWFVHVQTWVLRSEGKIVLVDTGVGNGRDRPSAPWFTGLRTAFLDRLAAAGVTPEQVDIVINTHIHADHVGWNTVRSGDAWLPAFPNARYLIPRADRDRFDPRDEGTRDRLVFEDSVAPILRAGLAVLWEGAHTVDGNLALESAPGHTPGSSVLHLRSGASRAVFAGDLLHSPVQLLAPDSNSSFCLDQAQARASRRRVLADAADTGALLLPAHFPGPSAAQIVRNGDAFAIRRWAAFPRPAI